MADEELYVGYTSDPRRRFAEHNSGKSKSTKGRVPFELIYCEAYKSQRDAMHRERSLKLRGKALGQLKRRIEESLQRCGGKGETAG